MQIETTAELISAINKNRTIKVEFLPVTARYSSEILGYIWVSGDVESSQFGTMAQALYDFFNSIQNWDEVKLFDPSDEDDNLDWIDC